MSPPPGTDERVGGRGTDTSIECVGVEDVLRGTSGTGDSGTKTFVFRARTDTGPIFLEGRDPPRVGETEGEGRATRTRTGRGDLWTPNPSLRDSGGDCGHDRGPVAV